MKKDRRGRLGLNHLNYLKCLKDNNMIKQYHDYQYLALVEDVLQHGVQKTDRTGTGTLSVFGREMRFNLENNTIPLLTTKKIHTRSIIHELLWYLEGNTSSDELERNKVTIWREWKDQFGELGKIYGHQWRNWERHPNEVVFVEQRTKDKEETIPPSFPLEQPTGSEDCFIGTTHETREYGPIRVLDVDEIDEKGDHKYTIQFLQTGYKKSHIRKSVIQDGHIVDVYLPRVFGVGYLGEFDKTDPNLKQLQRQWYKILERCYNSSAAEYALYGGAGVFVESSWFCFANFQRDVKHIPNWNNKRLNPSQYQLDKDFYQSNCYSKSTCVWLTKKHNTLYRKNPSPIRVRTPDGQELIRLSVTDLCSEFGLTEQTVYDVLNGKRQTYKGFRFERFDPPKNHKARYALPIDQIQEVVNTLRNDPDSRRIIVSAWNVGELNQMALPPCHAFFQFNVNDGKLSCKLTQRSCDVGLGVPFNIAQYSILTLMMAHITGFEPGEFIWSGGDVHIYTNHIDALRKQLERFPYESPTLWLNPDVKEIDNFTFDDIKIEGYKSHPTIKMAVSV